MNARVEPGQARLFRDPASRVASLGNAAASTPVIALDTQECAEGYDG